MMGAARSLALALVLFAVGHAKAAISGPTQSSGQFTLVWTSVDPTPGDGTYAYLLDVVTGDRYDTSPVSFNKQNGTYVFEETMCLELWSSINCYVLDAHTVTVSGATPPPPGAAHVVKRGDIDGNGSQDYAVIASVPSSRQVDDFILRSIGGGEFAVITAPTSAQISTARNWPTISAGLAIHDINADAELDVTIYNVAGIDDIVVWSADNQPGNFPTRALTLDADVSLFMSELASSLSTPNYYANAITTELITVSGWYVVTAFLPTGGLFYDENGVLRNFPPGLHTILQYFTAGTVIEVLDSAVVVSYPAYVLDGLLEQASDGAAGSIIDAAAQILIILREVLNTDIGAPETRGPHPNDDEARGGIGVSIQVLSEFCDTLPYLCNGPGEVGQNVGVLTICAAKLGVTELWKIADPRSYYAASVPAPNGFNHTITSSQRSTSGQSTDAARRTFWNSRLQNSKDPAAPLAIDVVDDEYALGCLANERYESFRDRFGGSASLTAIGSEIMRAHVAETDLDVADSRSVLGKLGPRQLADYHHRVFGDEGLPPRTFGATPITGNRNEARRLKFVFCPSCDDD